MDQEKEKEAEALKREVALFQWKATLSGDQLAWIQREAILRVVVRTRGHLQMPDRARVAAIREAEREVLAEWYARRRVPAAE
jgi:hypothetical protein